MRKSAPIILLIFLISTCLFSQERGFKVVARTSEGETINLYKECHALVIGVSDYMSGWPVLPNAVHDAEEIGDLLSNLGFKITDEESRRLGHQSRRPCVRALWP